jgi:hypothetical protein
MLGLKTDLAEIQRQQARINAAYDLHHEVLKQYGYETWLKLAPPDEIIEDDRTICVVNYLDL